MSGSGLFHPLTRKWTYSETSQQRTPSGPQNSVRYREVSATSWSYNTKQE